MLFKDVLNGLEDGMIFKKRARRVESHKKRREHTLTHSLIKGIDSCPQNSNVTIVLCE